MKNQLIISIFCFLILNSMLSFSQGDKAAFVPYENKFYSEIKAGIKDFNTDERTPRKSFKMDYEGKDIPKSIDEFTKVWSNDGISQGNTGTCWCFSTSSFYESEIYRLTKQKIDLSELYTVYWEYVEKAREYMRTRGKSFFGEGSETNAVIRMMNQYGVVPLVDYDGMKEGQVFHDHSIMFNEMKQYLKSLERDNAWNEEEALATIKSIMNFYMGVPPTTITYKGKSMTPLEFFNNVTKLKASDYVNFMSLMQKPYYSKAEYKVPDNWWRSEDYCNVPLDDFMSIIKKGIKSGYSLSIGGDVSESGYNANYDVAMVPSYDIPSEHINEYSRQLRFSNGSTTDDHAIHLIGYKENKDDLWFLIKDSGSGARNGKNNGYYFYHKDYVKLKTMTFTVHKDAAKEIMKKMLN